MILMSTIDTALRARVSATSTEDLTTFIQGACAFYSLYNPYTTEDVLPLLIGINTYELPYGVSGIRRIDWWPYGEKTSANSLLHNPNLLYSDDAKYVFKRWTDLNEYRCRWIIESGNVIVFPTPTADEDVDIIYTMPHEYNSSVAAYMTIPDEDLYIIVDLATAEYLNTQQVQMSMLPDFSEGMTSVSRRYTVQNLSKVIENLRNSVRIKYAG